MVLYHAQTMKEMRIDKVIEQSYNEDSQEYKMLCDVYKEIIGFEREHDKDEFDKELLKTLAKEAEQAEKETIAQIEQTIKTCYLKGASAYVSFGGYMINPKDFLCSSHRWIQHTVQQKINKEKENKTNGKNQFKCNQE